MSFSTVPTARRLITAVIMALLLAACGNSAADIPPEDAVNIRIANETGFGLSRIWLGGGTSDTFATFNTRFVNIDDGDVSTYLPVEPVVWNYNRLSVTNDENERFRNGLLNPHEFLGVAELSAGTYYTITLGEPDDEGVLALVNVTVDDPP